MNGETGGALDENRAFRRSLGAFATGVVLVTADAGDDVVGIVVNSFTSVSLEPRIVLWCLGDRSYRYPAFAGAQTWGLSVLAAEQIDISRRFAEPGGAKARDDDIERLGGVPVLRGGLSRLACGTRDRAVMGDHLVIYGQVLAFDTRDGPGLTYFRGQYGMTGG